MIRFTGDEYNYYINWLLHVILGRLGEADGLIIEHGGPIRRMAGKLRRHLGVPTRTIWRGLLFEPGEVPPDRMVPPRPQIENVRAQSTSWSEDKDVGCWFADRDSKMSMVVRILRPAVVGWMMKITPQKKDVLWHWSWQTSFPAPRGPGTVDLAVFASMHPSIEVEPFDWALKTQKEVILLPLRRAVKVIPYDEVGCPPTQDLNRQLGGPLRRNPCPDCGGYTRNPMTPDGWVDAFAEIYTPDGIPIWKWTLGTLDDVIAPDINTVSQLRELLDNAINIAVESGIASPGDVLKITIGNDVEEIQL